MRWHYEPCWQRKSIAPVRSYERTATGCSGSCGIILCAGTGRCGVQTPQEATDLARAIACSPALRFDGLMTYPNLDAADAFIVETKALLTKHGIPVERVSGGGTPVMWQAHTHPEITEPYAYPLIPNRSRASEAQVTWLDLEGSPRPAGAHAVAVRGVETALETPVWVMLHMPPDVPPADLIVGRLTTADGVLRGTFQVPAAGVGTEVGTAYELSIPDWRARRSSPQFRPAPRSSSSSRSSSVSPSCTADSTC